MKIILYHKDWAEQDPEIWLKLICEGTKRAKANIDTSRGSGIVFRITFTDWLKFKSKSKSK